MHNVPSLQIFLAWFFIAHWNVISRIAGRRQFVPSAFRKLVPPRCNTPLPPFDLSILLFSLSPSLSLSFSHFYRPDLSLFHSLPLSIWLSCGACTISISCGSPVADSRHESRHHPAGVCRGNAKRQTGSSSPSPLLLHLPIRPLCLSLSLSISFPPHLFVSRSLLSPIVFSLFLFLFPSFSRFSCLSTERWWSRG